MIYVTGYEPADRAVVYLECVSVVEAEETAEDFQANGLMRVNMWAVAPTLDNHHFTSIYPEAEMIVTPQVN